MPSESHDPAHRESMQWKRRFVDLRSPYLHIHSVPDGEAINAINLTHARIDHDPDFKRLLGSGSIPSADGEVSGHRRTGSAELHGLAHVFAVYGEQNTFLFAARSESQKVEWILKIDQSYFGSEEEQDEL
jgi:kinesin family protein 1